MSIIVDDKIKGSPDLLIEILSPSNEKMDTEIKKEMYQQLLEWMQIQMIKALKV